MSAGRVVVTGAAGFVGRHVCAAFAASGRDHEGWVRRARPRAALATPLRERGDLATLTDGALDDALEGVHAIVHLAARGHVAELHGARAEAAFHHDNVEATARLARAAKRRGVARFVHISTVKVSGEWTPRGHPFRPDDPPAPQDAYGRSKRDAEAVLRATLADSGVAAIVLRLPLVYGAGAPGNFAALVDAVRRGRLLPLGAIDNRRHLLRADALAAAIGAVLDLPQPPTGTHFVADARSVSTPELVRAVAAALGVRARLLAVPVPLLRAAARLAGRAPAIDRLTRSLEVDTSSFTATSGWQPRPFAVEPAMVVSTPAVGGR